MNTKKKGTHNEHRSMALLEASGCACTRAAASLGVFDIVGISATDIALVQVTNKGLAGRRRDGAAQAISLPACKKIVHRWRHRARLPDVREL
jgi:hypothetical protein